MVWSPGGDALAYTTLTGLRVYFGDGSTFELAQGGLAHLSWSPDGGYLAAEMDGNIWWVYRRDGTTLALTAAIPFSYGTAWVSAGELVFAPPDGGLALINLDAANQQSLLVPPEYDCRLPALTPDGRLVFFSRLMSDELVPPGFGALTALTPGATELEPLGLSPIDLSGSLRWTPGAALLVAFEGGVLALFDPASGEGFPLPIGSVVAYGWGVYPPPEDASALATPEAVFPDAFTPGAPPDALPTAALAPGFELATPEASAEPMTTPET
jgi:hypothetical protein